MLQQSVAVVLVLRLAGVCSLFCQILLYNLETSQCLKKMGNSMGDFTCVNLRNSPPNMLVTGNKDRR